MTVTEIQGCASSSATAEARACFDAGDYAGAIDCCGRQLEMVEAEADRFSLLLLKACAQGELGQFSQSLEALKMAGPLIDNAPLLAKSRFHGQRAYVYVKLERLDAALVDYEEARFGAQQVGDGLTLATVRNNLAKVYGRLGRYDEAIDESDAAIAFFREADISVCLGRAYDQRAQILNHQGRFVDAIAYSKQAIALLADHPSVREAETTYGRALIGVGETYLHHPDVIEDFCIRRAAALSIDRPAREQEIRTALERCAGNVKRAAAVLKIAQPTLLKSIRRNNLNTYQGKHLRRSIVKK